MKLRIRTIATAALIATIGVTALAHAEEKSQGAQTQSSPSTGKAAKKKGKKGTPAVNPTMPVKPATPPEHIQVQHILIGFKGSVPGKPITRSKEEAQKLAEEILQKARNGEDYDSLVKQYTEDQYPGIYGMANRGTAPAQGEYARDGMVPAFGNVGFELSVGNVGMAEWDAKNSPYGWHIIKRVK